jgi:hypothetical protein
MGKRKYLTKHDAKYRVNTGITAFCVKMEDESVSVWFGDKFVLFAFQSVLIPLVSSIKQLILIIQRGCLAG